MIKNGLPVGGSQPPSSTGETLDELLHVMSAPQVGNNQPAEGSAANEITPSYRQDPQMVYPAAPQKIRGNNSTAKAEHGLHFSDVGFSVVDKGMPCMGGEGGEKEILRSVTGQVFRGDSQPPSIAQFTRAAPI